MNRPQTTVILAMTVDGKISDRERSPARFASPRDKAHLEEQIALADGVLFGAGTLSSYGTTLPLSQSNLIEHRQQQHKPPQPVHIVCSYSGKIDPQLRFFSQLIPRWLLTSPQGAKPWQSLSEEKFERIITVSASQNTLNWNDALQQLYTLGIQHLAVLGGGELIASLVAEDLIDEFWFTLCPLIVGGKTAPTPVEGVGFTLPQGLSLELLKVQTIDQEVFLHYQRRRS